MGQNLQNSSSPTHPLQQRTTLQNQPALSCSAAVHRGSISCQSGIREILKLKSKCFCETKFPPPSSCSSANFVRALIDRSKMWRKSFVCWRIYRNCVIQRLLYSHFLLGITSMMNPTKVDILLGLWCSKLNLFKFLNYLLRFEENSSKVTYSIWISICRICSNICTCFDTAKKCWDNL